MAPDGVVAGDVLVNDVMLCCALFCSASATHDAQGSILENQKQNTYRKKGDSGGTLTLRVTPERILEEPQAIGSKDIYRYTDIE